LIVFIPLVLIFILSVVPIITPVSIPNYLNYQEKAKISEYAEPFARRCAIDIVTYCVMHPNKKVSNPSNLENCSSSYPSPDGATIYLDVPSFSCSSNGFIAEPIQVKARHSEINEYKSVCDVSQTEIKCFIKKTE